MQVNWQPPLSAFGLALGSGDAGATGEIERKEAPATRRCSLRDRFDYRLIFAFSFLLLVWLGVIERCNPLYWISRQDARRSSLWDASIRGAHHCATVAFKG